MYNLSCVVSRVSIVRKTLRVRVSPVCTSTRDWMMLIQSVRKRLFFFIFFFFSNRNVETSDPGAFHRSRRDSFAFARCHPHDRLYPVSQDATRAKALGLSSSKFLLQFFLPIILSRSLSSLFFINFLARYLYKLSYSFVRHRGVQHSFCI